MERDVAAEVSRQARGALRPRVALNFEINTIDQNVMASDNESYGEARSRYGTTTMELTIRQPIYDAARWRQMGVADAQRELTRVKAEQARNDLIAQMTDSFLDVAQAQFLVRRSGSVIRTRQAFVAMLEASREAGRADLSTLLRAEGDILSAEGDLSEAEMERTQALFSSARFVGGEVTAVALTDNRFGMIGSEDLRRSLTRERLFDISPQMQIARAELALAQRLHHRSKAGYLPTVNLTAEVGVDETDGTLFGGGSKIRNGKVGVGIEVPLYQGGVLARHASAAAEALRTVRAEEEAGRVSADVVLERELNVETIDIEMQVARLQQLRLQLRLLGLFGALDVNALSRQLNG
ncbi:TolC family protein [Falsigemmobacter intermedius]|uniref:TolC family protein n=1 Tax=Falsigemmobacter intermedius TaxID=1553448 RepID=UPI00240E4F80|nr:TolC family protein [Falsigemmobacter intermedius]